MNFSLLFGFNKIIIIIRIKISRGNSIVKKFDLHVKDTHKI